MLNKFIEHARKYIGKGYVYGTEGGILTYAKVEQLKKRFGISHYDHIAKKSLINTQTFDCSGLIWKVLHDCGIIIERGTAQFFHSVSKTKLISQVQIGDLVFITKNDNGVLTVSHVGIYIGNNRTIEAKDKASGVVYGKLSSFNSCGTLPYNFNVSELNQMYKLALLTVQRESEQAFTSPIIRSPDFWESDNINGKHMTVDMLRDNLKHLMVNTSVYINNKKIEA